jgi:hypothetical protein
MFIVNRWLNQYSNYQTGNVMNTAYNTFLTALMVEYYHDQIADYITTQLNVTWSRTSPAIVSVDEDAYQIYMTLESDHSMGMTVVGTPADMWAFNFVTSSYISPIEYTVMCGAYNRTFSSVAMDLYYLYLNNNTFVETFVQNGFIIQKSIFSDDNFLVLDLETGIVRDINTVNNLCGIDDVCYGFQLITCGFNENVTEQGEVINLGTFFWWNGIGRIYIASLPIVSVAVDKIWVDDVGTVSSRYGTLAFGNPQPDGVHPVGPVDITILLRKGYNVLSLNIKDVYDDKIGCSSLWIVQGRSLLDKPPLFPNPSPDNLQFPLNTSNPTYKPFD